MELKVSLAHVGKVLAEGPQKPQAVTTKPHGLKSVYRRLFLQTQLATLNERVKSLQAEIEALSAVEATGKVLQSKIEGARR